MIGSKRLPIALIASVAILAGGGILYLRIKPGPGKQLTVTKPNGAQEQASTQKEEALTPAEKVVKRELESNLNYDKLLWRSPQYKEVENDGYEAVVIASVELRENETKEWFRGYKMMKAKLVGNSWTTDRIETRLSNKSFYTVDQLRAWRDVKVYGVKEARVLPPVHTKPTAYRNGDYCLITTKIEVVVEGENKGDKERAVDSKISIAAVFDARQSKDGRRLCGISYDSDDYYTDSFGFALNTDYHSFKIPPQTKKGLFTVTLESHSPGRCCVFKEVSVKDIKLYSIDGYKKPSSWWLENPEYIP